MKRFFFIMGLVGVAIILQSHEFWLEPMKFRLNPGESTTIAFAVGENFTGGDWDLGKHKAEKISLFEVQGETDFTDKMPTKKGDKLKFTLVNPGTKLIALRSSAAFIKLNGEKFNQYLEDDGLENVIQWRKLNKKDTVGAREFYTRYAKLFLECGEQNDETWKKVVGHRLEIVPMQNPNALKSGDYLTCKLLFFGKPSAHTTVKIWGRVGNKIFLQDAFTENDGTVKFPISASGAFMVSAVRMERSKKPDADWESSWASLVFSVE